MSASDIAIAVDAARDAAHRARTDAAEDYTRRCERACAEVFAEIETANAELLGEVVWSALDGIADSKLHLIDELFVLVRGLTAQECRGDANALRIETKFVMAKWREIVATAVTRIVDNRMQEGDR
jgi:hypothetical protein